MFGVIFLLDYILGKFWGKSLVCPRAACVGRLRPLGLLPPVKSLKAAAGQAGQSSCLCALPLETAGENMGKPSRPPSGKGSNDFRLMEPLLQHSGTKRMTTCDMWNQLEACPLKFTADG